MTALRRRLGRIPALRRLKASIDGGRQAWSIWPAGLREREPVVPAWPLEGPEPSFPGVVCQACTDNQIRDKAYRVWGERLRVRDVFFHRKQWEWFYIAQALDESGVIRPGARGLGFGVGSEPLAPWFAAQGCALVATDYPGGEHAADWSSTGELARALEDLNRDGICDPDRFAERVSFRPVDMRSVPDDLRDFDFCWSSCALEHLGSLDAGLQFVVDSLATLRPGGVAVHTTELNISSQDHTTDSGPTVLYRRRDLERLADMVAGVGRLAPLNFNIGSNPNDTYVAPHGLANTQLRLQVGPYVTTSFGLVVTKHA